MIINPPFGLDPAGKKWDIDGFKTDQVDHAIVMRSLKALPNDGKAVLIIGSKGFEKGAPKDDLRRASAYANQKRFYDNLYKNYNVTDHFTVAGDLYA